MLVDLTNVNFDEWVMAKGIAVIDCWAPWCAACKDFTPTFEAAARRHPTHTFAKLNTQDQSELAKRLKVNHIPTTILLRDGLLLLRQPGYLTQTEIDQAISTAEDLDMAQVRADMKKRTTGKSA